MPALLDIWRIDLDRDGERLLAHTGQVGTAERRRGVAFARPADRAAYLASHVGLRMVLALYGPMHGDFHRDGYGKPRLPGAPEFSLSRTRGLAVIAIGDRPVGIDIEAVRPLRLTEPAIAWMVARRNTSPLEAWTALEAWAKWRGCGMGQLLERLDTDPESRAAWWASASPLLSRPDIGPPARFCVSLCSEAPRDSLSVRTLRVDRPARHAHPE